MKLLYSSGAEWRQFLVQLSDILYNTRMLLFVLKLSFQGKDNLSMKFIAGANKAWIASPVT